MEPENRMSVFQSPLFNHLKSLRKWQGSQIQQLAIRTVRRLETHSQKIRKIEKDKIKESRQKIAADPHRLLVPRSSSRSSPLHQRAGNSPLSGGTSPQNSVYHPSTVGPEFSMQSITESQTSTEDAELVSLEAESSSSLPALDVSLGPNVKESELSATASDEFRKPNQDQARRTLEPACQARLPEGHLHFSASKSSFANKTKPGGITRSDQKPTLERDRAQTLVPYFAEEDDEMQLYDPDDRIGWSANRLLEDTARCQIAEEYRHGSSARADRGSPVHSSSLGHALNLPVPTFGQVQKKG